MRLMREATMRTFPSINVAEAFHPLSHHGEDAVKHESLVKVQAYQTEKFASSSSACPPQGRQWHMLDN